MKKVLALGAALSCMAVLNTAAAGANVEFLNSGKVVPKGLPLSEAVKVGETLYLSGQIGLKPGTMEVVKGGVQAETRQTMDNIKQVLELNDYAMSDVVKCTVILTDISQWSDFNKTYQSYFKAPFPARTVLGSNGLALGAQVEVECMAAK